MTAHDEPVNPFAAPGVELGEVVQLCPFERDEHDELYVDVCGTGEAFREFTKKSDVDSIAKYGRMALVVGDSGYGKTATVNRCITHTKALLSDTFARVFVLDLTDINLLPPQRTDELRIPERIERIRQALIHELEIRKALTVPSAALPESNDYIIAFRKLGLYIPPDVAVIAQLPTSDLVLEIAYYAKSARFPRIMFIAECAPPLDEHEYEYLWQVARTSNAPLIILELRALDTDEVNSYLDARLSAARGVYPTMGPASRAHLAERCKSIRLLEWLCFTAYQRRLNAGDRYTAANAIEERDFPEENRQARTRS